jgi:predicted HTH transcriptional regulator
MSAEEVRLLVEEGEGRSLEFKRGLPRDERLARTLCAFANTRGGVLLVGILDKGGVHGTHDPKRVMADIRRVARDYVAPPVTVQTTVVSLDGKAVVAAQVPASTHRPHARLIGEGEREVVVRVGASNRIARGATLDALRRATRSRSSREPLEQRILEWVDARGRSARIPGGDATIGGFALAQNIGIQRARRAFVKLEQDGLLVGHGRGKSRVYHLP